MARGLKGVLHKGLEQMLFNTIGGVVNWFPGHMAAHPRYSSTNQGFRPRYRVGDSRIPSVNADLQTQLLTKRRLIRLLLSLNKKDLAHPNIMHMAEETGNEIKGGEVVIGIDLGTTFSCVAVAKDGGIEIIANDQGNRTTPSFVSFSGADQDYERLIGDAAKNQATLNPGRTFFDVKRLIGKKFDDPEVEKDMKYLPYPVLNREGKPYVQVKDGGEVKEFSAEEISAMVLAKMKETAESYLGKTVNEAVVTVPAYFNDAQRQATKDAGTIAGLNVLRIINEPTAGALAYGWKGGWTNKRTILVYDLGGGTFDVSILEIEGYVFKVLATGGDTHLGGGDFDQRVMEYFIDLIKKKYRKDVSGDSKALGKLRRECERAKRALSSQLTQVRLSIDSFVNGMDFSEVLTRARFEEINLDLFKKTLEVVESVMKDAEVGKSGIDDIVLVGGSTRIPKVREMLRMMFNGKEPSKGVNPDEAVAYGAAVLGAKLSGAMNAILYDVTLCDVTPLSLGFDKLGGLMSVIIPRNTPIPTKMTNVYWTIKDRQTSMNIMIYQGERPLSKDCIKLGGFVLYNLTPAPRGDIKVDVTLEIDENGILTVTAREKNSSSARPESISITSYKGNLTKTEIESMITTAKNMSKVDKKAKARVEAMNKLEKYIYDVKNAVTEQDKGEIESELEETSLWLDRNQHSTKEDYEKKLKALQDRVVTLHLTL
ncbi:Luminal-binding protein [Linum perenne]